MIKVLHEIWDVIMAVGMFFFAVYSFVWCLSAFIIFIFIKKKFEDHN